MPRGWRSQTFGGQRSTNGQQQRSRSGCHGSEQHRRLGLDPAPLQRARGSGRASANHDRPQRQDRQRCKHDDRPGEREGRARHAATDSVVVDDTLPPGGDAGEPRPRMHLRVPDRCIDNRFRREQRTVRQPARKEEIQFLIAHQTTRPFIRTPRASASSAPRRFRVA